MSFDEIDCMAVRKPCSTVTARVVLRQKHFPGSAFLKTCMAFYCTTSSTAEETETSPSKFCAKITATSHVERNCRGHCGAQPQQQQVKDGLTVFRGAI